MANYVQPQQQQQIVMQQLPAAGVNDYLQYYRRGTCKVIGYLVLLCAILNIVLESCYSAEEFEDLVKIGTGIWASIFTYLPAGILGVISGHKPSRCNIIANMVLCIIAAVMSVAAFSLHVAVASFHDNFGCVGYFYPPGHDVNGTYPLYTSIGVQKDTDCSQLVQGTNIAMAICDIVILVLCIVASSLCCRAVCQCCRDGNGQSCCSGGCCEAGNQQTVVVYYAGGHPGATSLMVPVPDVGYVPTVASAPAAAPLHHTAGGTTAPPPYELTDTKPFM